MIGSDDFFKKRPIEGIAGIHTLIRNNAPAVIGYVTDKLRYTKEGGCIAPIEVCFVLECNGREYHDFFYFENNILVYQVVTIKSLEEQYLSDLYSECAQEKEFSPEEFIRKVVEAYVMKELGF